MGGLVLAVLLLILNVPVYWMIGVILFPSASDFLDTIRLLITPRILDLLRGEAFDDQWAHFKVAAWLFLCGSVVFSEYTFVAHHMPGLVERLGDWWGARSAA